LTKYKPYIRKAEKNLILKRIDVELDQPNKSEKRYVQQDDAQGLVCLQFGNYGNVASQTDFRI